MTAQSLTVPPVAFQSTYARLPERFYERLAPTPVASPRLIALNEPLARELGLDPGVLALPEGVALLAGNRLAEGSEPIAMAYAGHQFGSFVPQLGDGRAILLGEVVDSQGQRRDIQLKGSGPTRFSRRGDGRAALGPVLREFIVSEAFAALGIPSTRALAAVATGEWVFREEPLPGAVLTRVASSHIRVGTFQYFAVRKDVEGLRALADYAIGRHYPQAASAANPYRALLDAVIARQAALVARWLGIGFIHGVMNTDNTSIAGETIDFGPCAFMDSYHPATVYSSIDQQGRYAYGNQPRIIGWNMARLAETLIPLLADDEEAATAQAQAAIDAFPTQFEAAYARVFGAKLGLPDLAVADLGLVRDLLEAMGEGKADFTLTFRGLCDAVADPAADAQVRSRFEKPEAYDAWAATWRQRLAAHAGSDTARQAAMRGVNPLFIPRNHLVEEVIVAAVSREDFAPFEALRRVLAKPYEDQPGAERYTEPPQPEQVVRQTFCGT
jgi:serine/tyrosine/threonine adenylyltransferase